MSTPTPGLAELRYDAARCRTCGVPWAEHSEKWCPWRHAYRPDKVADVPSGALSPPHAVIGTAIEKHIPWPLSPTSNS